MSLIEKYFGANYFALRSGPDLLGSFFPDSDVELFLTIVQNQNGFEDWRVGIKNIIAKANFEKTVDALSELKTAALQLELGYPVTFVKTREDSTPDLEIVDKFGKIGIEVKRIRRSTNQDLVSQKISEWMDVISDKVSERFSVKFSAPRWLETNEIDEFFKNMKFDALPYSLKKGDIELTISSSNDSVNSFSYKHKPISRAKRFRSVVLTGIKQCDEYVRCAVCVDFGNELVNLSELVLEGKKLKNEIPRLRSILILRNHAFTNNRKNFADDFKTI